MLNCKICRSTNVIKSKWEQMEHRKPTHNWCQHIFKAVNKPTICCSTDSGFLSHKYSLCYMLTCWKKPGSWNATQIQIKQMHETDTLVKKYLKRHFQHQKTDNLDSLTSWTPYKDRWPLTPHTNWGDIYRKKFPLVLGNPPGFVEMYQMVLSFSWWLPICSLQ